MYDPNQNSTLGTMEQMNKAQSPYDRPMSQQDLNSQMMGQDQQGMAQAGQTAGQTGDIISQLLGSSGSSGSGSGSSLSGLASIISLFA